MTGEGENAEASAIGASDCQSRLNRSSAVSAEAGGNSAGLSLLPRLAGQLECLNIMVNLVEHSEK